MDDLNLNVDNLADEMFNNEKNAAENNIEDPFVVTDTNSSSDVASKTNEDNCEAKNVDENTNNQNEEMIVNDSIEVNDDIQYEKNLNEINQLESDQRSDVIDLMYDNQEAAITNEKLTEELNGNLDVVSHEEEVRTTVEKESTIPEVSVETVITNELCENQSNIITTNLETVQPNKQTENQKNLFPSPILPLRAFSTSKISIQKLPKAKPTTSAAANEDNTSKNLNGYSEKSSERKRKPDESIKTTTTKTTTTRSNTVSPGKVRYRQIKIVRLVRQTTTLTFRETYNPASKDYESMTLLSTKKSKEIDSESTECRVITEKEYNEEEANYFRQIDEDNDRNFTTNSSANSSTSEENQHSAMNNHRTNLKTQELKTTRTASKRTIARESSSEESETEETKVEKKQNTQINTKNTPKSTVSSKTPTSTKKPLLFQSKLTAKKNPLTKRDLNSFTTTNTNNLAESNSKTSSSIYSSSRTPSYVSSSPSIDSIVYESDQARIENKTRKSTNSNRFNLNLDDKLANDSLQVKLRRLTYDEMASANLVYKSDECNETSSESDDTLLNTTTLSEQQQQQQQQHQQQPFRPLRQVTNMKQCSVKLVRLDNLSNGHSGSNN